MLSVNSVIAILNIRSVDHCCIIDGISKSGATISFLKNANLSEKSGSLQNIIFYYCV